MRPPHIQYVNDTCRLKTDIQTILKMTGRMIQNNKSGKLHIKMEAMMLDINSQSIVQNNTFLALMELWTVSKQ